jgi:hypothetical protein
MDLVLDGRGLFCFVPGPAAGPLLSADAERTTLDQPCPVHGSATVSSKPKQESAESEDLCSLLDLCAPSAPYLELDPAAWAYTQFATAQLGDRRRTARLVALATQIAADPSSSLPNQTAKWSDLKSAYRLVDRPEATFQVIAEPH